MLTLKRDQERRWRREIRRRKLRAFRRTLMALYGIINGGRVYRFVRDSEINRQKKREASLREANERKRKLAPRVAAV